MQHQANHTTTVDGTASQLVAALEHTWQSIQQRYPEVPDAVLVVASGAEGKRLNLGHFAPHRWQVHGADRHEVLVGGEGLQRGPVDVLGTLLHEAAHGLAQARDIQDTSRQGRYHNANFKYIAEEMGIVVEHDAQLGWSSTTMPDETAALYSAEIMDLDASITAYRKGFEFLLGGTGTTTGTSGTVKVPRVANGRKSNNNGVSAHCDCGRKIRISQTVLDMGGITCNVCGEEFTA